MKKYILCFGFVVVMAGAARAEDQPQPFPTRDVTVHYKDIGGRDPQSFVMHFSAQTKKIRSDINGDSGDYSIMDIPAKHHYMIMDADRTYIDISAKKAPVHGLVPDGVKLVRAGEDTVAGLKCTVWNETGATAGGTVCITDDGVLLRSHYNDGNNETSEATAVEYGPQAASLFEVPMGYAKMEMPVMPGSMKMQGIPGMPGGMKMPSMPTDMDGQ